MMKFIPGLILLCFISTISSGQNLSDIDTGKYSIHLPGYWKQGNNIWKILSDKLPLVCGELKDKELCGDQCNPKYSIEFEMSEPLVYDYYPSHLFSDNSTETWDISTWYVFTSSLLLLNEKKELLTRLILVDTNEVWKVTHRAKLPAYIPAPRMKIYVLKPGYDAIANGYNSPNILKNNLGITGQSPYSYINNNKENLSPTRRDMLSIIDDKIKSW